MGDETVDITRTVPLTGDHKDRGHPRDETTVAGAIAAAASAAVAALTLAGAVTL